MYDYYEIELETLDRSALRNVQNQKLRDVLDGLSANPFYTEKLTAAGVTVDEIRSVEDLRRVPFTTKAELENDQAKHPPYGRLAPPPMSAYQYIHQTSGTTGRPLLWLDTKESWDWFCRCWGFVYRGAGVTSDDVVFCAFSFGPYISHWTAINGAWAIGAMCVSGGGMNTEQRLRMLLDRRCTVLVCTPTYALHLIEVARNLGLDLASSPLRITIHAGEPGASVPNVKRRIEEGFGAPCFDHAGATEVGAWAYDCQSRNGHIHLNETEFIFEVIDPATAEPVPEGTRGELVVTNLGRPCMPVLRYRTGDLVEMTTEPCECGRTLARIRDGVLGRADDMMIVRGVNIYPAAVDNLIRGIAGIAEYQVDLHEQSGVTDLFLRIEPEPEASFDTLRDGVTRAFRGEYNIRVEVEQAESLPRFEFKARRYNKVTRRREDAKDAPQQRG